MARIGQRIIELSRERFGDPPRAFDGREGRRLRLAAPLWLRMAPRDPLRGILRDQESLLSGGRVVWGCVVQAPASLFRPGRGDRPALVIYSPDPAFDEMPEELQEVASRLFALKRPPEPADPDLLAFARLLNGSGTAARPSRTAVPRALVGSLPVYVTTVLVSRRHLPGGYLAAGTFPLIVHPGTEATMILPGRFWPPALLALWERAAAAG